MAIDDLKKRLFRKGEDFTRRYRIPELQKHDSEVSTSWESRNLKERAPVAPPPPKTLAQKVFWWGLGGGLGAILIAGGILFYLYGGFAVTDSEKYVSIQVARYLSQ